MPFFKKPRHIYGNNIILRNAEIDDAEFIVALRTDPIKGRFLSATSTDVNQQRMWLDKYCRDSGQVYFIIEDRYGERFGTVRLYDAQHDSFCWGSWILKEGRPNGFAMESALMVYQFALELGFASSHFDVRKENESVWKFHERFGAVRVAEGSDDFFYVLSKNAMVKSLQKYKRFLPHGIKIGE